MKLTVFTDYSLRVLIYVASRPDRRATIAEIADALGVSESHLTKVVHFLGKEGWLDTLRGKGGGVALGRPGVTLGVGKVVRATEGAAVVAECFDTAGGTCSLAQVCRLRGVLSEAVDAFYSVLDRYSLADLVANREALAPILFVEPSAVKTGSPSVPTIQ